MKPRRNLFLGSILVVFSMAQAAFAAPGTWSGTTTATWDTTATNWTGVTGTPWDSTNGATNTATFNLASLAATVSGTVYTNGITFSTTGGLSGGIINLAGTTPGISVATSQTGTIGSTISGSAGLTKTSAGTLILSGSNNYTGGTAINAGTVQVNSGGTLGATSGALSMGNGSAGTIGTVGNLTVNTNTQVGAFSIVSNTSNTTTSTNIGQLSIASGSTLTVSSLAVGVSQGATSNVINTALGTGSSNVGTLTVTGGVTVGLSNLGTGNRAITVADLSGLANFNAGSGSGDFRVGYGMLNRATMTLASTANVINVATISVGETVSIGNSAENNILNLGTGTNALQATTINIGTQKASGVIQFAGSNGSVVISGIGGAGNANISLGNANSSGTYQPGNLNNGLLLAGHTATVNAGTVIIGNRTSTGAGTVTAQITFDTGTFNASSITLARATNGHASSATAVNGTLTLGTNSESTGIITVSGNVLLASHTSSAVAVQTATGVLNILGGTLNVNTAASSSGGILNNSITTTGVVNTTLTLDGGTLNLNGGIIGGTGASGSRLIDTLNFRSGTLKNVAQINNGAGLTKTTTRTLVLEGTNAYGGVTAVNEGVLNIRRPTALGATAAGTTVATDAALEIQGTIITSAEALSLSGTGISNGGALRNISDTNTYAGAITLATASRINSDAGTLNLDVSSGSAITSTDLGVTFGGAGDITVSDAIALGTAGVTKDGAGILTYNANNTYTGTTTVNGGRLVMEANQTNNGDVVINDTGTIKMSTAKTFKSGTNVAVNTGGKWLLDGSSQTVGQLTGAGTIDMAYVTAGGADTLTVGSGDVSSTFDGVIQEEAVVTTRVIALTKIGTGTLTLTGANTHGGTTSVSGGILRISKASALGDTTAGTNITGDTATSRLELTGGISFAAETVTLAGRSTDAVHLSNLSGNNTWNGNISTDVGGNTYSIESQADKLTIAGGISVNQSGGRFLNLSGTGDGEVTGVISGSVSNTAALTKLGDGTWTLSGTNTYTGNTTVSAGKLVIDGSISNSNLTTVMNGATLGGSGSVGNLKIESGGILAPGNSPGILNTYDYDQAGSLILELNGISAYDQVSVTGSVTLSGLLAATVGGEYTPVNDQLLFILLNDESDAISGNFTGLAQGAEVVFSGTRWLISYEANSGANTFNGGNDVALKAIPEPGAALLGGLGMLALLRRRRD